MVYYLLSDASMAFAASYENTSKGEVTVGEGDTLSTLAAQVYGQGTAFENLNSKSLTQHFRVGVCGS